MIKQAYGTTQVLELSLDKRDIEAIIVENLQARGVGGYDFDYDRPILIWDGQNLIVRYVQQKTTRETDPKNFYIKPMPKEGDK